MLLLGSRDVSEVFAGGADPRVDRFQLCETADQRLKIACPIRGASRLCFETSRLLSRRPSHSEIARIHSENARPYHQFDEDTQAEQVHPEHLVVKRAGHVTNSLAASRMHLPRMLVVCRLINACYLESKEPF